MNATQMLLLQDIAATVPGPTTLIDMGSGNCVKSRMIIDALLERQSMLQFIPVDISEGNGSHLYVYISVLIYLRRYCSNNVNISLFIKL